MCASDDEDSETCTDDSELSDGGSEEYTACSEVEGDCDDHGSVVSRDYRSDNERDEKSPSGLLHVLESTFGFDKLFGSHDEEADIGDTTYAHHHSIGTSGTHDEISPDTTTLFGSYDPDGSVTGQNSAISESITPSTVIISGETSSAEKQTENKQATDKVRETASESFRWTQAKIWRW